jgi:hypothetical protein
MPLLLLFIALVVLAILAPRFGVESRDEADWSPPDRAPSAAGAVLRGGHQPGSGSRNHLGGGRTTSL